MTKNDKIEKKNRQAIQKFIDHFLSPKGMALAVSYPEDNPDVPCNERIDAIIEGDGLKIALEHTSIDSFLEQRKDWADFKRYIKEPLLNDLNDQITGRICISVHCHILQSGQDWNSIKDSLKNWLVKNLPQLPEGHGNHCIPNVPFKVFIDKRNSPFPLLRIYQFASNKGCHFEPKLICNLKTSIERKTKKLIPYGERGYKTYLLIESDDISLMNIYYLSEMVESALEDYKGILLSKIFCMHHNLELNATPEFKIVWPKS